MRPDSVLSCSFRDPSGFLFRSNGALYRTVKTCYKDHYDHLMNSGLYEALLTEGLLIPHAETPTKLDDSEDTYKSIRPEYVSFISYPYEWSFSQLKDAALTTLKIQRMALNYGMTLKDASAYNIQFKYGSPLLIDTLSFTHYYPGEAWVAYRQFCQHFLAPLALMCHKDHRLCQLLRVYIDGIPLDLASSLLPFRTRLQFSLLAHIHLHAKSQLHHANKAQPIRNGTLSQKSLLGMIENLEAGIQALTLQNSNSEWTNYYQDNSYSQEGIEEKERLVESFLDDIDVANLWDLGSNTGRFSRLAATRGIPTVSFDSDHACVENNYLECRKTGVTHVLPLILDLTNPSPNVGWANHERMSIIERGPADTILALALIHHLAIANNLPLTRISQFFNQLCNTLIIEFVPKNDIQVKRLLATREDIFNDYDQEQFEVAFQKHFVLERAEKISTTQRMLYLMRRRS